VEEKVTHLIQIPQVTISDTGCGWFSSSMEMTRHRLSLLSCPPSTAVLSHGKTEHPVTTVVLSDMIKETLYLKSDQRCFFHIVSKSVYANPGTYKFSEKSSRNLKISRHQKDDVKQLPY
jgi:hypothetical protein